jgi:hypothetical protein
MIVGVGYQPVPKRGMTGFGFNWSRPNETSYGGLDDQYTTERFWRHLMTTELAFCDHPVHRGPGVES